MNTILLPLPASIFSQNNFAQNNSAQNNSAQNNRQPCHSTQLKFRRIQGFALCLAAIGWLTIASPPGQAAASQSVSAVGSSATAPTAPQFFTPAQQAVIANALIGLGCLLPIGLGLGIFLSDRYATYRATLLKQHIETLERIWQESNVQH